MTEALQKQFEKEFKTTARKKLYFSLAIMWGHHFDMFEKNAKAVNVLIEAAHKNDCECGECGKESLKMLPTLVRELFMTLRPVWCVMQGLKSYKQNFGEYPEFARFIVKNHTEAEMDELIQDVEKLAKSTQEHVKAAGFSFPKKPFEEAAFGSDFVKACETIKLKGEV